MVISKGDKIVDFSTKETEVIKDGISGILGSCYKGDPDGVVLAAEPIYNFDMEGGEVIMYQEILGKLIYLFS